ncbi:MAG: hypothetical protein KKA32_03600 [Actinobacteria bacterium]|nr:hypothetical protein [Actinomycetota bacterium]
MAHKRWRTSATAQRDRSREVTLPRIFDNIDQSLLPELRQILGLSERADFCVGYLNLRGRKELDAFVDRWPGYDGHQCRLLVGMQRLPQEELYDFLRVTKDDDGLNNQTAVRLKARLAEEFRRQLAFWFSAWCATGWRVVTKLGGVQGEVECVPDSHARGLKLRRE